MAMTTQLSRCWSGVSCSRPLLSSIRRPGESLRQRHILHVREKSTLLAKSAVEGENQRPPEQRKDIALLSQENDDMECVGTGMDVECVVPLPDVIAKEENDDMNCIGTGLDVECVLPDKSSKTRANNLSVNEESTLVESVLSTLLLISPFFFWGTAMVAMKGILPKAGPMFVAATRLIPAGALLVGFARYV